MTRTPEDVLREAQTHFTLMTRHARGDLADQLVIDAICMRLSAGVEALARLDTATRDRLFGGAWPLMGGCATASHTGTCSSTQTSCAGPWSTTSPRS